ncbi:hypothetical protein ACFX2I_020459 [Malus domestica]
MNTWWFSLAAATSSSVLLTTAPLPTTPALPRPATIVTIAAVVASRTLHHHLCSFPLLPSVPSSNGDGKVSDIKAAPLFSCTLLRLSPRSCHQLQRPLSND